MDALNELGQDCNRSWRREENVLDISSYRTGVLKLRTPVDGETGILQQLSARRESEIRHARAIQAGPIHCAVIAPSTPKKGVKFGLCGVSNVADSTNVLDERGRSGHC
jgi:hypothetical protein